ncbi:MAG: fibronectin type III domain-containing protein [Spirochaetales bacterium]|nr:fibronectin type III domain-containing protein [Spirochaetales bacterium]
MKILSKQTYPLLWLMLLLPLSCSPMLLSERETKGEVNIKLDPLTMRSALPDGDGGPASYIIEGTHTSGAVFNIVSTATSVHLPELLTGEWTLHVRACDSSDQVIAEGTGSLYVEPGDISYLTIVLYDVSGTGTLDLSLRWNEDLIADPVLNLNLTTLTGDPVSISFTIEAGVAAGLTTGLGAGFYKLTASLLDGETVVAGTVETVLIANETLTAVDLDFNLINKKEQQFDLTGPDFTISWDSEDLSADHYRVYYREHGSFNWVLLGISDSGMDLDFTIDNTMLAYGTYDFAVSSVSGDHESEFHSSMDDTAVPATGWYINWESP